MVTVHTELIDPSALTTLAAGCGFDFHYLEQTGSTNDDAFTCYRDGARNVVVVADAQTAGRGRQGRQWISPPGHNIYCSIAVSLALSDQQLGLLSLYVGVMLCESLRGQGYADVSLKWPNDLLLKERKLGGILLESRAQGNGRYLVVAGFGINVLMPADALAAIGQPSVSLAEISVGKPDRNTVLASLLGDLLPALARFQPVESRALAARFAVLDAYDNQPVEVLLNGSSVVGINRGINDQGQLCLETGEGLRFYSSAEISLRASRP